MEKTLTRKDLIARDAYYDPDTGAFSVIGDSGRVNKGTLHGNGYLRIEIDGKAYFVHNLIWLLQTGEFPPEDMDVDHKNHIRIDNRWKNLRLLSRSSNTRNSLAVGYYPTPAGNYAVITGFNYETLYCGTYQSESRAKKLATFIREIAIQGATLKEIIEYVRVMRKDFWRLPAIQRRAQYA